MCSPARRKVSQLGKPRLPFHANPYIRCTHAIARQGQSFRLFLPFGQMYRGFENPRLFKDRPADGKRSGCAAPLFLISEFSIARASVFGFAYHFAARSDMVLRIILLRPWSPKSPPHPHIITATSSMTCPQCPQNNRMHFSQTIAAPSVGRSLNWADPRCPSMSIPPLDVRTQWGPAGQFCRLFCPWGHGHRGFDPPGYSKTVLRTEKLAAEPRPFFNICDFNSVGN